MKFLILASVLCFAAGDLIKRATPAVDESISAFLRGSASSQSLSEALGVDERWLDEAGNDIQTELGKLLKEAFDDLLEKIKEEVEHGKEIGKELFEKAKEIREELKKMGLDVSSKAKEVIRTVKGKAKQALQKLLDKLSLGKRNFDDQLDRVARSQFTEFTDAILDKATSPEAIKKIRNYIENVASDSELANNLRMIIKQMSDEDIRAVIRFYLQYTSRERSAVARSMTWNKIKNFFKDLKLKIGENSNKFGEWIKNKWDSGVEKLKEKYGAVKAIAMEYIAHAKDVTVEVAQQALEFFCAYKEGLGQLWDQLVKISKQAIGKFQ